MSQTVRIKSDVAVRVFEFAVEERRSFANMVEVLLLAALTERGGAGVGERRSPVVGAEAADLVPKGAPRSVSADAVPPRVHGVPMETVARSLAVRDGRCNADTPRGTKCKFCGKAH